MTRPDPRLLVPCEALPFVPDGARVWYRDPCPPLVMVPLMTLAAGQWLLDLSAPALRDGVPERLDALPWALAVLGWREAPTVVAGSWPGVDVSGLSPDEASRAVVAASLRGGR
jgi:hypothetical protein